MSIDTYESSVTNEEKVFKIPKLATTQKTNDQLRKKGLFSLKRILMNLMKLA